MLLGLDWIRMKVYLMMRGRLKGLTISESVYKIIEIVFLIGEIRVKVP